MTFTVPNLQPLIQAFEQSVNANRQQRAIRYLTTPDGYTLPNGQSSVSTAEANNNFWNLFIGMQPGQGFWRSQFRLPTGVSAWNGTSTPVISWRQVPIIPFYGVIPQQQNGQQMPVFA
jgi:hypothetical protein